MTSLLKFNVWNTFAILATLNVLDAASTAVLVSQFGPEVEANPVVRYWIEAYGVTGLYMVKFVVVAILGLVISIVDQCYKPNGRIHRTANTGMWIVNALLALIVINNVILVFATINT